MDIDDSIPPPDGPRRAFPFADLSVGQSFRRPVEDTRRVRQAASHWGRRHGWKFRTEVREEDGAMWIRTWRVE